MQELCGKTSGKRHSVCQQICKNRVDNELQTSGNEGVPLLGREGLQGQQALQKIKRIQTMARSATEANRQMETEMLHVRPQKLVVPSKDDPASMFEPSTWAMAFPDLFPWADGVPFLKRETRMDAGEVFRYLLLREELQYQLPSEAEMPTNMLPRWSLSALCLQ